MSFQPAHFGLFFNREHLSAAQAGKNEPPLSDAWAQLMSPPPDEPLLAALWLGYRYRFTGDASAAEQAATSFLQSGAEGETTLEMLRRIVVNAHVLELLRDSPAFDRRWTDGFADVALPLLAQADLPPDAAMWAVTGRVTAGIVLDDEALFNSGITAFQQVIDSHEIHPEGNLKTVAGSKGTHTMERQLDLVCALVLAAEAAALAGVNLWEYENRGVTVTTAAAYLVYYYFYPDKWRWSDMGAYTPDMTKVMFREKGAFFEIVASHAPEKALRGIDLLFDAQRPMMSRYGGMTTLTHANPKPKKRRGWFG